MSQPTKSGFFLNLVLGVTLLAVNLVLFNALLGRSRVGRVDLTEGKHYSLSKVTKEIIDELEEPGELTFYYSSPEVQHELLRPLIDPLKDLLSEFEAESDGKIKARFVLLDKAGQKEQEQVENDYGVRAHDIPVRTAFEDSVRKTYFSLVIQSGSDYEQFALDALIRDRRISDTKWEVELADIESLVVKALRKVARGFDSVPGALAARDKKASVTFYVTRKDLPESLKEIEATVTKVCEKLAKESGGRLELAVIDPTAEARTPEETETALKRLYTEHRVRPIAADALGEKLFVSWAVVKIDRDRENIPLVALSGTLGEADVKAELEGALKRLIPGYLPIVGVSSPDPPVNPMMMQMGQRPPPGDFQYLPSELGGDFEVKPVGLDGEAGIPKNVGALIVIRPNELSDKALYEIDQFVMRGGRLILCADSFWFDANQFGQTDSLAPTKIENTKLREMLAGWGVKLLPEMVVDTRCDYLVLPRERFVGGRRVREYVSVDMPFFARLDATGLSQTHPITTGLQNAGFFWATPLEIGAVPEGLKATVIATSSPESSTLDSGPAAAALIETRYEKNEKSKSHPLAVVLEGKFPSWFANRPIPGLDAPATPPKEGEAKPAADVSRRAAPLTESDKPGTVVVIGDSDFLSSAVFQTFFGIDASRARELVSGNLRLLVNALDYGGPDSKLIALRNRPSVRRPLSALDGLSPEERERRGKFSMTATTIASLLALLGGALGWLVYRKGQKPIALLPATHETGGHS